MRRTVFILLAAFGLAASASAVTPPNILLILADDRGYGDVGSYNNQAKVPTPSLDRLVREGMRFTDARSSGTVCEPPRKMRKKVKQ